LNSQAYIKETEKKSKAQNPKEKQQMPTEPANVWRFLLENTA